MHRTHVHSLAAYYGPDAKALSARALAVHDAFRRHGRMTERQCASVLGYPHKSAVQPRISELVEAGMLREVGSIKDDVTGKTVRLCELACTPVQMELAV